MTNLVAPVLDSPPLRRQSPPQLVLAASPAAGAHFVATVNDGLWWRITSVFCRLVTDANAASREVVVEYRNQEGSRFGLSGINTTVIASQTADYYFSAFQPEAVATVDSSALVPLSPVLLQPTMDFRIFVVSVQATDQLSRVRYVVEKFYPASSDEYPAFA